MATIISTKKVGKIGSGQAIYLDNAWGFKPGDLVQVTIELVQRGGEGDGAEDN